jgi:hypothetical protein
MLEPYQARLIPYIVPIVLYLPRPGSRPVVEHLACAESAPSPQAIRPPPTMPPRHRPRLGFVNVLAQPRLLPLSFSSCPKRRPLWPVSVAQTRSQPRGHANPWLHKPPREPEHALYPSTPSSPLLTPPFALNITIGAQALPSFSVHGNEPELGSVYSSTRPRPCLSSLALCLLISAPYPQANPYLRPWQESDRRDDSMLELRRRRFLPETMRSSPTTTLTRRFSSMRASP